MSFREKILESLRRFRNAIFGDLDSQLIPQTANNAALDNTQPELEPVRESAPIIEARRSRFFGGQDNDSPAYDEPDEDAAPSLKESVMQARRNRYAGEDSGEYYADSTDSTASGGYQSTYNFTSGSEGPYTGMNFSPQTKDTVISKGTIIRGTIETQDSVQVMGEILGDIECEANIFLAGKVRGKTSAANAYISGAKVDGDIQCVDVLSIDQGGWILGDVKASQADVEGKVKGNLDVRTSVSIGSSSSILGNISTGEIEIKRGAYINGQILMDSPNRDLLAEFEEIGTH